MTVYQVQTTEGSFVKEFDDSTEAARDAETRNRRAEEMGVRARYEIVPSEKSKR